MNQKDAEAIRNAAEFLQEQTGPLIEAIDKVSDPQSRNILRRDFASLIADIEEKFVFQLVRLN